MSGPRTPLPLLARKGEKASEAEEQGFQLITGAIRDLMQRSRAEREVLLQRLEADVQAQAARLSLLDVKARRRVESLGDLLRCLREASDAALD